MIDKEFTWTTLRPHPEQHRLWKSKARFNVVPAGRRSGKTEIVGKRKIIKRVLTPVLNQPNTRFFVGAPTRDQAKRIYWADLKRMFPPKLILSKSESSLVIVSVLNSELHVLGMDKPERIEGTPWDGGVLDEYGNMKKKTWPEHVRPALSDRNGWCDFIGVPEGRNHYFELHEMAKEVAAAAAKKGVQPEWDVFWWKSADILPKYEVEAARQDLDELTFKQEFEGEFVNFTGLAYYNFSRARNVAKLQYDPTSNIILCFDFNVSPGVLSIQQLQDLPKPSNLYGSGIIDEVYIKRNSNTPRICNKFISKYGEHQGHIFCYGDATGGAQGTAKVQGSDWALIKQILWAHFGTDRIHFKVPLSNPKERDRINSVNSRLCSYNGDIRMMIDPKCQHTIRDFEGTVLVEDGTGKIDKKADLEMSHLTDAIGYHIYKEWPVGIRYVESGQQYFQ